MISNIKEPRILYKIAGDKAVRQGYMYSDQVDCFYIAHRETI